MLSVLMVMAMLVSACAPAAAPAPTQAPAAPAAPATEPTKAPAAPAAPAATGEVTIGLLTDDSGSLAIYGPMLERGWDLGIEYATNGTGIAGGKTIKTVIKDTASNPDTGVTLAREAIEKDGAKILVGSPSSSVALAVSGVASATKTIYIGAPAATPDLTGKAFNIYTFRAGRTSVQDALTMGAALVGLGETFVQIAPDNAFGRGSAAGFYNVIKAAGGKFTTNDTAEGAGSIFVPIETTDFTPYLNQVLDAKAKVLVVTWAGTGFVPLFQQATQLGILKNMVVGTGMGDNQTMAKGYADAVGSVGVTVYHYSIYDTEVNKWLIEKHTAKFGTPPDLFTESGFNAAIMAVKALEATKGDTSADALIKALEGLKFDGPKGEYTVRPEDHVVLQPLALVKLVSTKDPDFKFFELVKLFKPEETAPPCAVPAELGRCKK
ncbi:MAG: substrate-binding domain-containing protein [Chloroflexi bacterium]|nr:substrate-binding domain-containing protein [Chloroflexota bacterium]